MKVRCDQKPEGKLGWDMKKIWKSLPSLWIWSTILERSYEGRTTWKMRVKLWYSSRNVLIKFQHNVFEIGKWHGCLDKLLETDIIKSYLR